jgi:hypothetical protein
VSSLQDLCGGLIRKMTDKKNVHLLPLPRVLKDFLDDDLLYEGNEVLVAKEEDEGEEDSGDDSDVNSDYVDDNGEEGEEDEHV